MVWFEFLACAALILFSGSLLSQFAEMLAVKTGMGRTVIGLVLLATITSLPELATGLGAVTLADAPDIAIGNLLGACVVNLMLIGLVDLFYQPTPILSGVEEGHTLSAGFGILLIGIVAWGLVIGADPRFSWKFPIGPTTFLILILYVVSVRKVFLFERRRRAGYVKAEAEGLRYREVPFRKIYLGVLAHGGIIVGAGIWLSFVGDRIATETGWGGTFVGTIFVAISTTLPEGITSFYALKLAAPDLAVANLFGSNLFNIALLGVDDLAYTKGPLLSNASPDHLFSAITALVMTGIAITGLTYRVQKKAWANVSWDGAALVFLYLLNTYLLFTLGKGGP